MIRRFAGLLACAFLLVLGTTLPAAAHDQLIASTPEEGAALSEAPPQIELEYNAEIIDATSAIIIQDDGGQTVHQAEPTVDGRFVRAPFPALAAGAYRLNWSVVSSDGHRIEGTIAFTLADGAAQGPAESTAEDAETTGPSDATEPDEPAETAQTSLPEGGLGSLPMPMKAIVGIAGIAAFGAVAAIAVRRLRTRREDLP